jgi:hypothetical protein
MRTTASSKAGWTTEQWCDETGVGRSTSYLLEAAGRIQTVHVGRRRIIRTPPSAFLAALAEEQTPSP